MKRYLFYAIICFHSLIATIPGSAEQAVIDEIREAAIQQLSSENLGSGYGALINFSVNPDISTATYYVESEGVNEPTINVYRLPLRYIFELDNSAWSPLVQANFDYLITTAGFDITEGESIDAEWRIFGGSIMFGVEIPVGKNLKVIPVIDGGLMRMESRADYNGTLSNLIVKPAFDGLFFNWDVDAWVIGAGLGVDYRRTLKNVDFNASGSLSYNYIETYDASNDLLEFDSQVTTFDINVDTVFPTGMSIFAFPLAVVVTLGNTTFLGPNRDGTGFEYFFEGGLSLEANLSEKNWNLRTLRLGLKGIYGKDVTGWSLILGYQF
jgi:hypothetical protein